MVDLIEGPDANLIRRHAKKLYSEREYRLRYRKQDFDKFSPKQQEFLDVPEQFNEVRLQAATQSGKTYVSMRAESRDARADYLPSHHGKRFLHQQSIVRAHEYMSFVIGSSNQILKQTLQLSLLGNIEEPDGLGTGAIPLDEIVGKPSMMSGLKGQVESVVVRRTTGKTGMISFRSMEQDISAFAGVSLDQVRWDEPGPINKYLECVARLTAVKASRMIYTATPTEGRDAIFQRFEEPSPNRVTIKMSLYDARHMTPEQIEAVVQRTPEVDRPMRIFGLPAQGSGNVYSTSENNIIHDRPLTEFAAPWMRFGWALDITHGGSASAFAAVLFAYDSQTDVLWIIDTIKLYGQQLPMQAAAIKTSNFGDAIVIYPKDSSQPGDAMSGETLKSQLKRLGLNMASTHAVNARGVAPSLEDGVSEVALRLSTGKLKVARHCAEWFDEYRSYHRKDRKIVAEFCDLLDATRVGVVGFKQMRALDNRNIHMVRPRQQYARGVDFNVWSGREETSLDDVMASVADARERYGH